jgi:phosphomannomutase
MIPISFGTDGWRAVIAQDFTFDNLERVARATAAWVLEEYPDRPSVVIGYDTRFLGKQFAELTARVMASAGIHTRLADRFVPTPAVSWATAELGCSAGIVITASHNPPEYSGFKIKSHHGAPADPDMIARVEEQLEGLGDAPSLQSLDELRQRGLIEDYNLHAAYLYVLQDRLAIDAIRRSGLKVGCNPMFGAGQGIVSELLGNRNVVEINATHNPGMMGQPPEPIERNLEYFSRVIREERCDVGLAFDGDADRIGMLDEEGRFVDSHKILALLVKYLHQERGLDGTIVKTFSTTDMLDRMADAYGLPLETTKIGFKYIAPKIVAGGVLVGGEESGGIAVKGHVPERDGIIIGLTVVEMMVRSGKKLSELVDDLQAEFGPLHYARQDLHTSPGRKERFVARLAAEPITEVAGQAVARTETLDGVKLRLADGWLMFRPSGTEPVLRIYAEAASRERAEALVAAGVGLVDAA